MSITISQQYAKIGVQTTPGKLEIDSEMSRLQMKQKHAKVNIDSELPKVLIDQYQCFAEAGLKNTKDLTQENSDLGKQKVLSFISKKVADGRTLSEFQNGQDAISSISKRDFIQQREFGFGFIPKSRPKIEVTGSLEIRAEPNAQGVTNGVEIEVSPAKLNINYQPSVVNIYEAQKAMIEIGYERDKGIDIKI